MCVATLLVSAHHDPASLAGMRGVPAVLSDVDDVDDVDKTTKQKMKIYYGVINSVSVWSE